MRSTLPRATLRARRRSLRTAVGEKPPQRLVEQQVEVVALDKDRVMVETAMRLDGSHGRSCFVGEGLARRLPLLSVLFVSFFGLSCMCVFECVCSDTGASKSTRSSAKEQAAPEIALCACARTAARDEESPASSCSAPSLPCAPHLHLLLHETLRRLLGSRPPRFSSCAASRARSRAAASTARPTRPSPRFLL